MIGFIMSDFDMFNFENKLRAMVQELIAPTIRRTIEVHETMEKLQRSDRENTEKLHSLEYSMTRVNNKLPLLDDMYKSIQELNAGHHNTEAIVNLKTESIMGQLELNTQEHENLSSLIKMGEDSVTALKEELLQHNESMTGLKEGLLYENSILSKKLEKTRSEAKEIWDIINERILKLSQKIDEFNSVAIPKVMAEVEMVKRKIEEDFQLTNSKIDSMITFEEFEKFGRSLKFEIDKAFQNFKVLSENSEKVEEYLDHYLPLESWGMISEAICSIDPKVLPAFVEFDKVKFDTLKADIEFDYLDIDGLSKRALDAYEESTKRRENLIQSIKTALKKEKKNPKKTSKNLKITTKDLSRPRREIQKEDEKLMKTEKNSKEKISEKSLKNPHDASLGSRKSVENTEKQETFVVPNEPLIIPSNLVPTRKYSINKIEEVPSRASIARPPDSSKSGQDNFFEEAFEEAVRSPTLPVVSQLPEREPIREILSMPSPAPHILKKEKSMSRRSLLEKEDVTSTLYFPVASRPLSQSSVASSVIALKKVKSRNQSSDDEEYSPRSSYNKDSRSSSPSFDPSKLEQDLESLKTSVSLLEAQTKDLSAQNDQTKSTLSTTLDRFSQDLVSNFALMHNEIKQLIQNNKQSRIDMSKTLSDFSKDLKEREKNIERVDLQFSNVSELLANIVEFCRVVHSILAQEEEDRENLSLIGISENKQSNKGYLSLKTECMSCSGNNTVVMSAFKMACINYNPSPIKYSLKTFTRKQLINLLGTFINESWRAATAKPPYDRVPPPTMSHISLTSENNRRRNRYSRSQYLELPSLNTSKQILDFNDTSIHSFREYKQ
jgi:hypothetical protein